MKSVLNYEVLSLLITYLGVQLGANPRSEDMEVSDR